MRTRAKKTAEVSPIADVLEQLQAALAQREQQGGAKVTRQERPVPLATDGPAPSWLQFQRPPVSGSKDEAPRERTKVYQLALWPEDKRAMPTEFIRSALFAAIQGKDATYLQRAEIANANDLRIVYTGQRLTQVHADVWEGIMYLARGVPESSKITFRARQFLKMIGRHTGKRQRDELKLWFSQLTATSVEVHDMKNNRHYWGSLLPRGADKTEGDDTQYVVEINRDLAQLFDRGFKLVDWEQRRQLLKKPLCLWLQHHFAAYDKPITVLELLALSGSTAQQLRQFRAKLKVALSELQNVGGLSGWRIDPATDAVHVTGAQSAASLHGPVSSPSSPDGSLPPRPEGPPISDRAKGAFSKCYPGGDLMQCLADWHAWLTKTQRTAERPDAAFLGFARTWIASRN